MATKDQNQKTPNMLSKNQQPMPSIGTYAAQCDKCLKWRVIPTEEEYEEIRSKSQDTPFLCEVKSGMSCDDPADIEHNASKIWVTEKPGIPKTPQGFKRSLVLRRDFSKMDVYYITPTGKKLRTKNEMSSFIEAHPKYENVSITDFNFTSPKVMKDTIPEDAVKKSPAGGSSNKKMKTVKDTA